jgi:hypothetical protein
MTLHEEISSLISTWSLASPEGDRSDAVLATDLEILCNAHVAAERDAIVDALMKLKKQPQKQAHQL